MKKKRKWKKKEKRIIHIDPGGAWLAHICNLISIAINAYTYSTGHFLVFQC
jgi:hypothetical protein